MYVTEEGSDTLILALQNAYPSIFLTPSGIVTDA